MAIQLNAGPHTRTLYLLLAVLVFQAGLFATSAVAAEFHVNAGYGHDANDGSQNSPWRTLGKAWSAAPSGATVLVSGGSYGSFSLEKHRPGLSDYITFKALDGQTPVIEGMSVVYPQLQSAFVRIEGFSIRGTAGSNVVLLKQAKDVQIIGNDIQGKKWASDGTGTIGVYIIGSRSITVSRNHIREVHRGMTVGGSSAVSLQGNFIEPKGGSGIQYAGGNSEGLIEANHIAGAAYTAYPADPDAVQSPHASIISVRSGDLVIRANLLHGMGSSSGIMFYEPDAAGGEAAYSDITLASNAIFNTINNNAIRIYNLGENVVLSNNLIFSTIRSGGCSGFTKDARYRYNTALAVHSKAAGHDGSGLHLYNNIIIGSLSIPRTVQESNNIIWSWFDGSNWLSTAPRSNSQILASSYAGCGKHPQLFEDGSFFEGQLDFSNLGGATIPNFRLAANSMGVNFADPATQASKALGTVGSDGFLRDEGSLRSLAGYNVGPYQDSGYTPAPMSPPNPPRLRVE